MSLNLANVSRQAQAKQDEELPFSLDDCKLKVLTRGRWQLTIKDVGEFVVGFDFCTCYRTHKSIYVCDHILALERLSARHRQATEAKTK